MCDQEQQCRLCPVGAENRRILSPLCGKCSLYVCGHCKKERRHDWCQIYVKPGSVPEPVPAPVPVEQISQPPPAIVPVIAPPPIEQPQPQPQPSQSQARRRTIVANVLAEEVQLVQPDEDDVEITPEMDVQINAFLKDKDIQVLLDQLETAQLQMQQMSLQMKQQEEKHIAELTALEQLNKQKDIHFDEHKRRTQELLEKQASLQLDQQQKAIVANIETNEKQIKILKKKQKQLSAAEKQKQVAERLSSGKSSVGLRK